MQNNDNLNSLITQYYKNFYSDQLGLRDWEERIESRIKEEENFASPRIEIIEKLLDYDFAEKKILVVGAGTGAEFFNLNKKRAQVHALEPNADAIDILKAKCAKHNIDPEFVTKGVAETMPYSDGTFDFVYCYTVLEHVQNVERAVHEMVRVTKTGGRIFIQTPNYRMPYEPHYKIFMPTFLPRAILKLYLWLRRRPTAFIDSLNFIHRKQILGIIRHLPVLTLQILHDFPENFVKKNNPFYLFVNYFGIERDFWFILLKLPGRRKS
ncbi:MAG: class I SAM-dependent methyltransferase [Sedimentisphaerales bacterium]|nr:class I SAM-dependent methyltransferase [Sedimentisphaerales bacterium]